MPTEIETLTKKIKAYEQVVKIQEEEGMNKIERLLNAAWDECNEYANSENDVHGAMDAPADKIREALWLLEKRKRVRDVALCLMVGAAMGWMLIKWADGCGEHFVDSDGVTHVIECK